jgi:exodeoxyribonuclease VII small subunit
MPEKKMNISSEEVSQFTYEEAYAELERIVRELEGEQVSLENTLTLYERGQQLVRHCTDLLEKAELRLQTLSEANLPDLEAKTLDREE